MPGYMARNVKSQTDRILRQMKFAGEIIEYQAGITYGATMTVTFANKYALRPACFATPSCTVELTQDENDYYTGATLTPVDTADTYDFMAICPGKVSGV